MIRRVLPLIAVVLITSLAILASARVNRSGDPDATIVLTERELPLERASDRDSVRRLVLRTHEAFHSPDAPRPSWLTLEKLESLGIVCHPSADGLPGHGRPCGLPQRVFVVYEYDGAAWQAAVADLQRRREAVEKPAVPAGETRATRASYENTISYGSRLVSVDASRDASALRRAYPDGRRYLIVPAVARTGMELHPTDPGAPPVARSTIHALTTRLMAPAAYRGVLSRFEPSESTARAPRYTVTLAVGAHHEPWIVAIDPIDSAPAPH